MIFNVEKVGTLLSVPIVVSTLEQQGENASSFDQQTPRQLFQRAVCDYENCSERFVVGTTDYTKQYARIYSCRLQRMGQLLTEKAKEKWGPDVKIMKLHEQFGDDKVVVIGTLFKNMQLQPSILKDISEEHSIPLQPAPSCYCSADDKLILEDETQRIQLKEVIDVHSVVTGVVVAVQGKEVDGGKFIVEDFCFADPRDYISLGIPKEVSTMDRWVVLVSGFGFGNNAASLFNVQLFIDAIIGLLGDECEQEAMSRVCRVVIAGNSLSRLTQDKDFTFKAKYLTKDTRAGSVEAMQSLDDLLEQLVCNVDVDIMPGEFDPTNHILPQQPFHPCMLPKASRYTTLHGVPNPYEAVIDKVRFLGTSGQNIDDINRYSKLSDRLEILEKTFIWGHLAPTAPDTLGAYPFYKNDPFIIERCPHVYFAGNQPEFATKLFKGPSGQDVRLITIPSFADTASCVLLNLNTLDCQLMTLNSEGI